MCLLFLRGIRQDLRLQQNKKGKCIRGESKQIDLKKESSDNHYGYNRLKKGNASAGKASKSTLKRNRAIIITAAIGQKREMHPQTKHAKCS